MPDSEWRRVPAPPVMLGVFPNMRVWQKEVADGGHLSVIRTIERLEDNGPWLVHVSVSHRIDVPGGFPRPGRYPTWDEQKEAVWRFAPGKRMASYLPKEGDPYINLHETAFHWWEVSDDQGRPDRGTAG